MLVESGLEDKGGHRARAFQKQGTSLAAAPLEGKAESGFRV